MITERVPDDFESDGCTFPAKILARLFGADRYHDHCREHDFLRRHAVIPWIEADWLLAKRVWQHGLIGKLRAPLYFIFIVVMHPLYRGTQPLPAEWREYCEHYN